MISLFWDASALLKRYTPEKGSDTVDAVFQHPQAGQHLTTLWIYAETYSILCRKRNDHRITDRAFNTAVLSLEEEVLNGPNVHLLPVEDTDILEGLVLVKVHGLNSSDAIHLAVLLRAARISPPTNPILLIAADKRLARAAAAEGLRVLNPEDLTEDEIASLEARENE